MLTARTAYKKKGVARKSINSQSSFYQASSIPRHPPSSMSVSGIQGQPLEVTVVGCSRLKDTEWISRQDPYVCVEYGSNKFRTRTCTDGGKNPTFQEKFVFNLIEGLREINVNVWNSNSLTYDDFIGSGKVQLLKVLSQGFDDSTWPLHTKTGRHAGEVRLIMHYAYANKPVTGFAPSAPPYSASTSMYPAPPSVSAAPYAPPPSVSAAPYASPPFTSYSSSPYPSYPPASAYPPAPFHTPQSTAYAPSYPPDAYRPPHSTTYSPTYPPHPQGAGSHYPPGPFPGTCPPPY